MTRPVIVIPAFVPADTLPDLARTIASAGFPVVVVDDGSGAPSDQIFRALDQIKGVLCVKHALNLGKGSALRTGINHALTQFPDCAGVVTADADGQHLAHDILAVADALETSQDHLILGARQFEGTVPLRSRTGNSISRSLVRVVVGHRIQDTQTGLRGIPVGLARELLRLKASGYEFELDMLIVAKHLGTPVREQRITTVYEDGNRSSHFQPVRDSMKVCFVLFRFGLLSAITSLLDNLIFAGAVMLGSRILAAQAVARAVAMGFNYFAARRAVFLSREPHTHAAPRYVLLVVLNGALSYALLSFLADRFGFGVVTAKVAAELALFVLSFLVQRDLVFTRPAIRAAATDWDSYYRSVFPAAHWTRRYTTRALQSALRWARHETPLSIIEFGGANSCFAAAITRSVPTSVYYAADLNRLGLEMISARHDLPASIAPVHADVLRPEGQLPEADVVMSVGLIEHFDPSNTRTAIENHFRCCKPGGLVILSYPTPTLLYRVARFGAELLRAWRFPDERPLPRGEVYETAAQYGSLVEDRMLWPLVFTQRMMTFRKTHA